MEVTALKKLTFVLLVVSFLSLIPGMLTIANLTWISLMGSQWNVATFGVIYVVGIVFAAVQLVLIIAKRQSVISMKRALLIAILCNLLALAYIGFLADAIPEFFFGRSASPFVTPIVSCTITALFAVAPRAAKEVGEAAPPNA